ncbi:MAG: hemolysin family protein [Nitrospirota bacterium]
MWFEVLLILLLILLNGFFAASELAVIATRKSYIKQLSEEGDRRAMVLEKIKDQPERFIATIQIGVTLVGAMAAAIGGAAAAEVLKPIIKKIPIFAIQIASEAISIGVVVVIISYLSLVLGELVPKSLALKYPEKISIWVAKPIKWFSDASSSLIDILTASSNIVLKPFKGKTSFEGSLVSEEEIKLILKEGREKGVFDQTEQELIHSVFEFADRSVREVTVPATKIVAIQIDTPIEDVLKLITEEQFTRYPVYNRDINDIQGILYDKDLFAPLSRKESIELKNLIHPAYFIPESMKVSHLLKEMQRRRIHMAIVVNEYGGVAGLVTMEDLIEEIVGEIQDEYDIEKPVEMLKNGVLVVDASISVRDLNEDYSLNIPESPEYETLGGFVLTGIQRMPRGGETVKYGGYKFTIVDMEGRRISKIRVEVVE